MQTFPADAASSLVADKILQTLGEAYEADVADIEVQSTWIPSEPCPPRNGPCQNLAGIVNNAPSMAATAVYARAYKPKADLGPNLPASSAADLIGFYGARVTAEIQRLRVNAQRRVFVAFQAGIGYVQCRPDTSPPEIYCEAQSADSWEALASVLTPERIARLHSIGFTDPGRGPNYWKTYPADQFDDGSIARELLTVPALCRRHSGSRPLKVVTEEVPESRSAVIAWIAVSERDAALTAPTSNGPAVSPPVIFSQHVAELARDVRVYDAVASPARARATAG